MTPEKILKILVDVTEQQIQRPEDSKKRKKSEHKDLKGLKKQPLRDHMTPIELIFNMLGEQATIGEVKIKDAQGYYENLETAKDGGKNASVAREAFEKAQGVKVVSSDNFFKKIKD